MYESSKRNGVARVVACMLVFVTMVSVTFFSFGKRSGVSASVAASSLTLISATAPTEVGYMAAFTDDSLITFMISYMYPRANDSIEITMDDNILVTPYEFAVGDSEEVNVSFSDDATKMRVTFTQDVDSRGVLTLVVPFVYNKLQTRSMYEPQYSTQYLYFTDNGSAAVKQTSVQIRNELYDFASSVYNPYIKAAVEKIYWTADGELRVRMNAFYNYGQVTMQEKSRVRIDNNWTKNTFFLDRDSITVTRVDEPVVNGSMNTAPYDYEAAQIWKYGDKYGANSALQASFADSRTEGWYMQSETTNKYFHGQAGGFKGSEVAPTDALLIKYELKPYTNFLNTVSDLYSVSTVVTGTVQEPYDVRASVSGEISLKSTATFKIPLPGGGVLTSY